MEHQTWTGYPRSGAFLSDPCVSRFLGEFNRYPEQTWDECRRGDLLLAAAEVGGCPKESLVRVADELAKKADVVAERFQEELDEIAKKDLADTPMRGRYTRHWRGHLMHGLADLTHCIAHADHLTGHDGAQHAALCADHFIAALRLAYVDPNSDDHALNREKGIQEGYRITEELVRKHISFDMLDKHRD